MKKGKMMIVTITVMTMTNAKQKVMYILASWFQESAYFLYDCSENNN